MLQIMSRGVITFCVNQNFVKFWRFFIRN